MDNILKFSPTDKDIHLFHTLANPTRIPADATCYLLMRQGKPRARLTLRPAGSSVILGHYEALDTPSGVFLLNHALIEAKNMGAHEVIGPMDGTTWEKYRLAMPLEKDIPHYHPDHFTGDLQNPPEYVEQFVATGFTPFEFYESRITDDLTCRQSEEELLKKKMEQNEIDVSSLNMEKYDEELKAIYELSLHAFAKNKFFQPISFAQFNAMYSTIKSILDPELIFLAKDKKQNLAGFAFAYPDLVSHKKRVVCKTIAVSEAFRGFGIAVCLWDRVHLTAHAKGYKSVIHAFLHSETQKTSSKFYNTSLFRRYALFHKKI